MRWDLYLVSQDPDLRVRPKTAVHLLNTLITDGRVKNLTAQEDPEGIDDEDHVLFRGEPGHYAHSIFYEGPKLTTGEAFDSFELTIFSERRTLPFEQAPDEGGVPTYWFWLRLVGAQHNFTNAPFAQRLQDALYMTARAVSCLRPTS